MALQQSLAVYIGLFEASLNDMELQEICASYGNEIQCVPGELFIAVFIFDCFLLISVFLFGWSLFDWFKRKILRRGKKKELPVIVPPMIDLPEQ